MGCIGDREQKQLMCQFKGKRFGLWNKLSLDSD